MGVLNNKFKDVVFCKLFGSEEYKDNLLSLFNALNNTEYDNPDDLRINTIGNSVFMGMKNDLSCILDSYMELFEEQSTVNPNAPVRGMLYFSRLYETYIDENDAYRFGSKLVRLPTPRYFVLYLGKEERPDKEILRLSKAFIHPLVEADYEWTATVLNVNIGHNKALLSACRVLKEYSQFVECSRRHLTAVAVEFKKKYSAAGNKGVAGKSSKTADGNKSLRSNSREIQADSKEILWYRTSEYQEAKYRAMIEAVDECIRNNILRDFLIRNKAEVVGMYLT